ncbi:hypothetical protein BDK51DRAFT_28196 [Blyttiomyces helicus]|uniref:Uncharacterized protein n=1 Tax=Blyttiomyces helicus TaxID=388810 RepID=A0A4P9WD70_9FUNG|nr:hypothetical protein BDK51DRAFT_28196 [Blyttiomyces helicus]|eukprot:RKO89168.1 hypothetical protein BDK51DRAFT_28196 [Blyttiomyces helicus]
MSNLSQDRFKDEDHVQELAIVPEDSGVISRLPTDDNIIPSLAPTDESEGELHAAKDETEVQAEIFDSEISGEVSGPSVWILTSLSSIILQTTPSISMSRHVPNTVFVHRFCRLGGASLKGLPSRLQVDTATGGQTAVAADIDALIEGFEFFDVAGPGRHAPDGFQAAQNSYHVREAYRTNRLSTSPGDRNTVYVLRPNGDFRTEADWLIYDNIHFLDRYTNKIINNCRAAGNPVPLMFATRDGCTSQPSSIYLLSFRYFANAPRLLPSGHHFYGLNTGANEVWRRKRSSVGCQAEN